MPGEGLADPIAHSACEGKSHEALLPPAVDLFSPEGHAAYEKIYPLGKVSMFMPRHARVMAEFVPIRQGMQAQKK